MKLSLDRALLGLFSVALPVFVFIAYANAVHAKYVLGGPYLFDMGWINYLVRADNPYLNDPKIIGGHSYYATHMTPLLYGFHLLSRILNLKEFQPLEVVVGVGYGAAALGGFLSVRQFLKPAGVLASNWLAAAFALVFCFSGIMTAIAGYPHFEILYVGLGSICLFFMFQQRTWLAWLFFLLCVMEREDAGLHIACVLFAYVALTLLQERRLTERARTVLPFLAAALAYSAAMVAIQRIAFPGVRTIFTAIYSGDQPYRHLTWALVAHRAPLFVGARLYVTLTLVSTLAVFAFRPRPVALTGLLAAVPWFVLNVTAISPNSGEFSLYYPFPFLVLALAPFIVCAESSAAKSI